MKRRTPMAIGAVAAIALTLTACSGGTSDDATTTAGTSGTTSDEQITLTLAGWSLSSTPEFQTLADAFTAEYPNITVVPTEYDATNYDTQMTADLAAGTAPDIYIQKNLKMFYTYQSGQQLVDVSDVTAELDDATGGKDAYTVDGVSYAVPYRQDSWVLYYNKDLFAEAGVAEPDGTWTWDDYAQAAIDLTEGLAAAGSSALGTYQHSWQSTVQGFALAQTEGADLSSADYSYLAPYYERSLALQDAGAQVSLGTVTTNSLTYQAQFGTQEAAMLPMGSWYTATLVQQQADGDAEDFEWGMAPAPQLDESTTGLDNVPVTFADPTGLGINPAIDDDKIEAAKLFLAFAAGEGGALPLAEIGITPALLTDTVTEAYFALDGIATDDLSKFAFQTHDTRPENPVASTTVVVQNILNDFHTAVLSESTTVEDVLAEASSRAKSEAGL